FLMCRCVVRRFVPALLGGYVFGFSAYMLGQILSHLVLAMVFPIALAGWLIARRLQHEISARRFAVTLALVMAAEFFCQPELFATMRLVIAMALLVAYVASRDETRRRVAEMIA